jgi:DNA repair exonuclease SbcCD nuclease subunit
MKFAFSADFHLSRYGQDEIEVESNLPERLNSIKKALIELAMYCINNKIPTIILGGDLLHGKSIIYAIAQYIMIQYFKEYGKLLNFYVFDGNHDLSGKGKDVVSALESIQDIPGVTWIPFNKTLRIDDGDVLLVPYSYEVPKIVKENKARILISHFGLSEGVLNSGMSIISDISVSDLVGKYELVLLGHYHKPQEIIKSNMSLYYVGSPIQLDWGEKGEEKRFLVVDTDTLQVDSIPFTQYKKHIEVFITDENKDAAIKEAQEAKESGHHVKVIMKERVDLSEISKDFNIIDKTEADITDRGITSSMSQEDRLRRYIEIKELPEEVGEEYLKEAIDIIQNCEV